MDSLKTRPETQDSGLHILRIEPLTLASLGLAIRNYSTVFESTDSDRCLPVKYIKCSDIF